MKLRLTIITIIILLSIVFLSIHHIGYAQQQNNNKILLPQIDGEWWSIAKNPDLGEYNSSYQQPVDFAIWQADDDSWQLWSCIRGAKFPETPYARILYGWEGKSLTSTNWEQKGIKWVADPSVGETPGGSQAPYVMKEDNIYYLFYGDWRRICLAKSSDGKSFTRVLGENGQPDLFSEEHSHVKYELSDSGKPISPNPRDPMVLKIGNTYYCYYTSHLGDPVFDGWAFCRTSLNLMDWSESVIVSRTPPYEGHSPMWSDECPFVIYLPENNLYYLFVTQIYGRNNQTTVYASPNPMYFGIDDDSRKVCTLPVAAPEIIFKDGQYYIAALNLKLDGIRIAKLKWE